jgi:hypothetical protein
MEATPDGGDTVAAMHLWHQKREAAFSKFVEALVPNALTTRPSRLQRVICQRKPAQQILLFIFAADPSFVLS